MSAAANASTTTGSTRPSNWPGSVVPTLIAALHRLQHGEESVEPRDDLAYAANYLHMVTGTDPDPVRARAVEAYLVSTIDHGFNASTFTGRVIASAAPTWPRASWAHSGP